MKTLASLKNDCEGYQKLVADRDDIRSMIEMTDEEPDTSVVPEIEEMMADFRSRFEAIRIKTPLSESMTFTQCHRYASCRDRRNGSDGLDEYALPHVHALV